MNYLVEAGKMAAPFVAKAAMKGLQKKYGKPEVKGKGKNKMLTYTAKPVVTDLKFKNPRKTGGKSKMSTVAAAVGTRSVMSAVPRFKKLASGAVEISHTEYLTDLNGQTGSFQIPFTYSINPADPTAFPWLSTIARQFETFEIVDLRYRYDPSCPTTTGGFLMIGVDYDVSDAAPVSKQQLMNFKGTAKTVPWEPMVMHVSKSDAGVFKRRFTNYLNISSSNQDIKMYYMGIAYIGNGQQANNAFLGELYVDYTVRLYTPQQGTNPQGIVAGTVAGGGSLSNSSIFGTVPVYFPFSSLTLTAVTNVVSFAVSPYSTWLSCVYVLGGTITAFNCIQSGNTTAGNTTTFSATIAENITSFFNNTGVPVNTTLSYTMTAASVSASRIWVVQLPAGLSKPPKKVATVGSDSETTVLEGRLASLEAFIQTHVATVEKRATSPSKRNSCESDFEIYRRWKTAMSVADEENKNDIEEVS